MTTEELPCAKPDCEYRVQPDEDYVKIDAESKHIHWENEEEEYYLHPECWEEVTDGWRQP